MEKEKHIYYDYEDNPHIISEIINERSEITVPEVN